MSCAVDLPLDHPLDLVLRIRVDQCSVDQWHVWCGSVACVVWISGLCGVDQRHVWCGSVACVVWITGVCGVDQ